MGRNQRFKILKTAIKKYKAPVTDPTTAFFKYDQFEKGKANYKVDGQERGDDELVSLVPFGFGEGTDKLVIQVSGRLTDQAISANALTRAELGLSAVVAADDYNENFIPAKIVVKLQTGTDKDNVSQITGVPYTKVLGDSYTFPFGRKTATDRLFDRQLALYNIVEAAAGKFSVTFKPERMYGSGG